MRSPKHLSFLTCLLAITSFGACQQEAGNSAATNSAADAVAGKPTPTLDNSPGTSPGKPSAPISMRYEVIGNPVVGSPVAVNVEFSAAGGEGPVQVQYSIADNSAVAFQQGQVERLEIRDRRDIKRQQLTVIPQREGRVYVNVSAEVETDNGTMIKSMAIPIQVGTAPNRPTANGEVVEGPDGEQVISLPASENL